MSNFCDELEFNLDRYRQEYRLLVNGWLESGTFGITYPALLVETFHYVKHSCSLMSYACAQLGHEKLPLQAYFARHIAEEVGHEEWVLNDLEELGYSRKAVESSPPLAETVNLIGSQLYVINYLHPAGLLGYVYLMESTPPNETALAFLEAYGLTSASMSFLINHGQADQTHSRELRDMLNTHLTETSVREAATLSAVIALSNVNRLLARLKSGNFTSCFPETTNTGLTSQPYVPRIPNPLSPGPSSNGGHDLNQNRKRRNRNAQNQKDDKPEINAAGKKHSATGLQGHQP